MNVTVDLPPYCKCGRPMRIETGKGDWLCLPCDITREQAIERYERTKRILKLREEILHGRKRNK